MRFEVRHLTRYRFQAPVFLDPHSLRLKPRSDPSHRLISFEVDIQPSPAGSSEILDLDGNETVVAWFDGQTSRLMITSTAVVATTRPNPFHFLWLGARSLPLAYSDVLTSALAPYRGSLGVEGVRRLGDPVASAVGGDAQLFLPRLAAAVHEAFRRTQRLEGEPLAPEETLRRGEGSCRDLAVLLAEVCRAFGFAARFVSGYHASEDGESNELHAWTEVYVPGGGWRGYDPTTGLAVSDSHIAVAAAVEPSQAAPVSGSFWGPARFAELTTGVIVRKLDES